MWTCEEIALKELLVQAAVPTLSDDCENHHKFDLISRYMNNDYVHLLPEPLLNVLRDRFSRIGSLDLTEMQQRVLSSIVQNRMKGTDPRKSDLWNSILGYVLPVK